MKANWTTVRRSLRKDISLRKEANKPREYRTLYQSLGCLFYCKGLISRRSLVLPPMKLLIHFHIQCQKLAQRRLLALHSYCKQLEWLFGKNIMCPWIYRCSKSSHKTCTLQSFSVIPLCKRERISQGQKRFTKLILMTMILRRHNWMEMSDRCRSKQTRLTGQNPETSTVSY